MNASKRYRRFVLLFLCAALLLPTLLLAQEICEPISDNPKIALIRDTFSCKQEPGITYRFTKCVEEILDNLANKSFGSVLQRMNNISLAVLSGFVALFGTKMVLGGVRNLKGESMTMLLKTAFVSFMTLSASGVVTGDTGLKMANDMVQDITTGLVSLVSSTLSANGECAKDETGAVEKNLWKRVDCSILAFIGKTFPNPRAYESVDLDGNGVIDASTEANVKLEGAELNKKQAIDLDSSGTIEPDEKEVLPRKVGHGPRDLNCDGTISEDEKMVKLEDATLFEIGLSQLFTPHGIFILALLLVCALMVLIAFAKALQVYVISLIAITFLMLLAPIFLLMFLFNQTRNSFVVWATMLLGYMIQPALLMGFLVFMLASINVALHGDSGSPGLKQTLAKMNEDLEANTCTRKVLVWSNAAIDADKENTHIDAIKSVVRTLKEQTEAVTAPVTPINYSKLSVFIIHLMGVTLLLYVLMTLMLNVGDFVGSLTPGAGGNLARFGSGFTQLGGAVGDAVKSTLR